ncbi:OmpA family protein [Mucilaginibacter pallidiroseus]|uniref:OmpA family protein n=1 Tax=Mucilaginibacter pallidiroseus TaxID=2599295 RepID=A0A563UC14_9SPHI|nr:OmpA family protein [Mucilaginibacter pallidiroseus]TWR28866.1 OmpA family protein [Mucilaginibacter pallidiroseus]
MKVKVPGLLLAIILNVSILLAASKPQASMRLGKKRLTNIEALTKNIEFEFCKATISDGDRLQLNDLAAFLTKNNYAIALRGHADAIGTYIGNWKMSEARADVIKAYLVNKGVAAERIVTTAFGSTIPIANNRTSKGRQKNRRVEMRLKEIGG